MGDADLMVARSWRLLRSLPQSERLRLVEALIAVTLASLLIAVLPFRVVVRTAGFFSRPQHLAEAAHAPLHRRLRWAMAAVSRRVPWRALCFQQGLACQWMLRRRGQPAVLFYGAAMQPVKGLSAHVWVGDGEVIVIGGEQAAQFTVLARFPESGS